MVLSEYPERIREVISSYQEWDNKAREASKSIQDLTDQIQSYVDALHDVSIAQRDANIGTIDNRGSIINSLYAATNDWWSYGTDGTRLTFENKELGNRANEYRNVAVRSEEDKNNLASSAESNINSQLKTSNAKNNKEYKNALNNAKSAMKASKSVASGDMNVIYKYSKSTYEKLYAYNLSLKKLDEARMEYAVEYAADNAQVYANIAEYHSLKDGISQNKIDQWQRLMENQTSASKKNNYLEYMIKEQDNILSNDVDEISKYQGYLTSNTKTITSQNGRGSNYKNLGTSGKNSVDSYVKKAQEQAKKGQTIDAGIITKLSEWYTKGYVSEAFFKACINYNNALEHKREAEAQYQIDQATAKAEKAALAMQKVDNIINDYENDLNSNSVSKATIERTHSLKETRGIALTSKDYDALIENSENEEKINRAAADAIKKQIDDNVAKGYWTTSSQEYKDAMQSYYDYLGAADDCKVAQEEYNNSIANLPYEAFDKALEKLDAIADATRSEIELRDAKGIDRTVKDYETLLNDNQDKISELNKQKSQLYDDYLTALKSEDNVYGGKTADEWYSELMGVSSEINGLLADNEKLKDELRDDVYWRDFERAHKATERIQSQLEGIGELIEETMYYNDDGGLSDFGIAKVANLTKSYELAREEVSNYSSDIENLNKLYNEGMYTEEEYNEKLSELQGGMLDAASSMKEYRDSIIDMFKQTGQQELDSLFELIDARNDALSAKKAYYDYDKNLRNQNKEINSIQAQIAALEGIDSAEARAKRARLEEQLSDAQEQLDDTITEHTMELSQNALDGLKESLQDAFDDKWEEISKSLSSMNDLMKQAYDLTASSSSNNDNVLSYILSGYGINSDVFNTSDALGNLAGQYSNLDSNAWEDEYNDTIDSLVEQYRNIGLAVNPSMNTKPNYYSAMSGMPDNYQQIVQNYDALIRIEGSADAATVEDLKRMQSQLLDQAYNYTSMKMYQNLVQSGTNRRI